MCDTAVVVRPDRVLFAKNSDRDPNEAQVLDWRPAAEHDAGTPLRCTWIEVGQVAHTHAVLLSRPFWMWGAEMGANEHGVVIGNEAVFTDQPYAPSGLTGMDLLRLALERATTAHDAVDTMVALLEEHGQGGGCGHEDRGFTYHNSFLVADASSAFVLETAGRFWAIEQVTGGARTISNGLTIPGFADAHADRLRGSVARSAVRRALTGDRARGAATVPDLVAMLRDHGGEDPLYSWMNGAMSAPCMHAGGLVAASQTTASWAAELGADTVRHWVTGTAAPCTGLFKPVRVDRPLDTGHPTDRADGQSLWWRHERLHRLVARDPAALLPLYAADRDALEARWFADPPDPGDAFAEGDRHLAEWTERVAAAAHGDTRPWVARRYWGRRDRIAGISPR